jgi:hypothetical protein
MFACASVCLCERWSMCVLIVCKRVNVCMCACVHVSD